MTGTRDSLSAMIGDLVETGAVRRRILQSLFPLLLTLPRRNNFKQQSKWCEWGETTLHNWHKRDLGLTEFNRELIERHGSGEHMVIFDPSYLPKSGKQTPGLGYYWSGQAGAVKRGIEVGSFAVGDLGQHTAFHLAARLVFPPCWVFSPSRGRGVNAFGLASRRRVRLVKNTWQEYLQ